MDHSSVVSGVINPCVTCDKNSMLHSGGTFDGSDITRTSVSDFPLSSANTTRFFVLKKNRKSNTHFNLPIFLTKTFEFLHSEKNVNNNETQRKSFEGRSQSSALNVNNKTSFETIFKI